MQNYMVHISNKGIYNWTTSILLWRQKSYQLNFKLNFAINTENMNIRWAFNVSAWKPTQQEISVVSSYIQPEEKERISKFIFQDDAKASLVGRLLMRKFVHITTSIPYENIRLGRDSHGKPYLLGAQELPVNFNISHQGDYAVLAGNIEKNIGIDVMKIEPPVNKNIPDFFRIMKRQFSQHEWSTILSFPTEMQQIAYFYRMWCLKESYVKNIGLGITVPLDSISFSVKTPLMIGDIVTDTKLYEKNVLKQDWVFEETLLDEKHAVAVSLQVDKDAEYNPVPYIFLGFQDLVTEAEKLCESDPLFAQEFLKKKQKEFKITD